MEKMKRALLSGFDPLPHALSTKGLSALVAVVVLGTGFTVQRYVESSQSTSHRSTAARFERPGEVLAAPSEGGAYGYVQPNHSTESRSRGHCGWRASPAAHPSVEAASSQTTTPTQPSMFQPEADSVGG
jgi:hypothetical protein